MAPSPARLAVLATALFAAAVPSARAEMWLDIATISATSGVNTSRVCVGGGNDIDIACPTNAPFVDPATGNVGIRVSGPNEPLEIGGTSRAFFGDGGGSNRKGLLISGYQSGATYARIESFNYASSTGIPLVINSVGMGNVGIGTTTPIAYGGISGLQTPLYIYSTGNPRLVLETSASADANSAGIALKTGFSTNFWQMYSAGGNLTFGVGSVADYMTLTSAGNVGIGTTAPGVALHVVKDNGNGWGLWTQANSSSPGVLLGTRGGQAALSGVTANGGNNSALAINPDGGSVGIGTVTPTSLLTIAGGEIQTASSGAACSGSLAGAIRYSGGTLSYCNGSSWTALGTGGGGGGSALVDRISTTGVDSGGNLAMVVAGNGGTVSFTTGGSPGTAYLDTIGRFVGPGISATTNRSSFTTIYASGNVGIGTSSPLRPLSVLRSDGNPNVAVFEASTTTSIIRFNDNSTTGVFQQPQIGSMGDNFILNTGNSERLRVNASGNVGIGTTTPTAKVEVVGTVSATYVKVADTGDSCSTSNQGTIRFINGRASICTTR
jgi:hypothetical protein